MKIKDVLNESNDIEKIFNEPYFKYNNPYFILKHSTTAHFEDIDTLKLRKRKFPSESIFCVHNYINELSKEKFGVDVRSDSLFTYPCNVKEKFTYTPKTRIVIPKGDYKLFLNYSVSDLTTEYGLFASDFTSDLEVKIRKGISNFLHDYISDTDDTINPANIQKYINIINTKVFEFFESLEFEENISNFDTFKKVKDYILRLIKDEIKEYIENFGDEIKVDSKHTIKITNLYKFVYKEVLRQINIQINAYSNIANTYVSNLKETKTVTEEMIKDKPEIMLVCDEAWVISVDVYKKLLKTHLK